MSNLLEHIPVGKENAVKLGYLAMVSGLSERKVRDEISNITTSGEEIICNAGNGSGYYIARDINEAKEYRAYNRSYWMSGLAKDKGIAKAMDKRFSGQMEIELGGD